MPLKAWFSEAVKSAPNGTHVLPDKSISAVNSSLNEPWTMPWLCAFATLIRASAFPIQIISLEVVTCSSRASTTGLVSADGSTVTSPFSATVYSTTSVAKTVPLV